MIRYIALSTNFCFSLMFKAAPGWLILAMLLISIFQSLSGVDVLLLSGALAWAAALLTFASLGSGQRIQALLLLLAGCTIGFVAWQRGGSLSLQQAIGQNQPILAMLAGVSFLRLLDGDFKSGQTIPAGPGAFLRTLYGTNFLASAINITALIVVSDRLARQGSFGKVEGMMMSRIFSLAVMYSPFIGGMGLTLALMPDAKLNDVVVLGFPYAVCGMSVAAALLYAGYRKEVLHFKGYPVRLDSMRFPAMLAILVMGAHQLWPDISVLALIAVFAPSLVLIIVLTGKGGEETFRILGRHVSTSLPTMSGELWLFLCAGVLAASISALVGTFTDWRPFEVFDAAAASITLGGILLVSLIGIHPIVCISSLAPVLLPLDPVHNLVALVFVMGWAIGCTLSPFSGTNLILNGRYGVSNWSLTRWNLGYGAIMYAVACAFLYWAASQYGANAVQ